MGVRCGEGGCEERSKRMGPGARGGSRGAIECHDGSEKCCARLDCVLYSSNETHGSEVWGGRSGSNARMTGMRVQGDILVHARWMHD